MEKNYFKHNWKNYVIGFLAILFIGSFMLNSVSYLGTSSYDSLSAKSYDRNSIYYGSDESFAPQTEQRMVIKNANIYLETDDYVQSKSQTQSSINAHSVIVLSENERQYNDDYKVTDYKLKIPSEKLDMFLEELKTYGEVISINVYANDVTGTYADYTQRVLRYQEQIVKYEQMLQKETTIEEEIQLNTRIDQLENQIFSLNNQIAAIDEDVSYSEVYISLKEKPSTLSEIDFLGIKDGFKLFMDSLQNGIKFILFLLGFVLPFAIVYGLYRLIKRLF